MNICRKFSWNPSTEFRDIVLHEMGANGRMDNGRMAGWPNDRKA